MLLSRFYISKQQLEKQMKKLRKLIAVMAMISMAAVLTGCGDDDDDDNDNNGNPDPGPTIVAPTEAQLTAPTRTYTANVAGQGEEIKLTFPAAGQYQIVQGAVTETGTYNGQNRTDNTWTMNLVPNEGQGDPGVLRLDFTSGTQGAWTFTPTGGQAEAGSFTVADTNPPPDPDPDPNSDTLTGKTLQLTAPNGAGERFDFTSDTLVSYEQNTTAGTYTWDPAARRINVTLNNGWIFEITIPSGSNTATVVFRDNASATPETSTATYTLTNTP